PEGDLNGDCVVDYEDVEIMADAWLDSDCNCIEEYGEMPSPPVTAPNMVAWYKFNDGSGDTANEEINNYDGTISVLDANVSWFTGHEGGALDFDGGWVSVPNGVTLLNLTDAVTVSCWIDRATSDDGKIVVKGRNDWETYALEINDNHGRFFVRDANNREDQYTVDSSSELPVNSWIHIAGTYDGNELTLYVNGRVAANSVHPLGGNLVADANDGLVIAGRWGDSGGSFTGTIDDVRIYDYALSGGEICYIASDGDGVAELVNIANVFTNESEQAVNLRDFVKLADNWLKRKLWPE
ncbi:MAG: LamG domain-containing protein, partial [Planctomycetota bacterium]